MRTILFKAKRLDNDKWVFGGSIIVFSDNGVKSLFMPQFNEKCDCEHDEITDDILSFSNCRFYKVDPETICQFTGKLDKNDNMIWENDIVRCGMNLVVTWKERCASFCVRGKWWAFDHYFGEAIEADDVEVIGNIFDNPELLKGGNNE